MTLHVVHRLTYRIKNGLPPLKDDPNSAKSVCNAGVTDCAMIFAAC